MPQAMEWSDGPKQPNKQPNKQPEPPHDPRSPPLKDPPDEPIHDPVGDPTYEPQQPFGDPTPMPGGDPRPPRPEVNALRPPERTPPAQCSEIARPVRHLVDRRIDRPGTVFDDQQMQILAELLSQRAAVDPAFVTSGGVATRPWGERSAGRPPAGLGFLQLQVYSVADATPAVEGQTQRETPHRGAPRREAAG
jgi:hypothetical protein